jgi:OOP family OmpA-OmpF porin
MRRHKVYSHAFLAVAALSSLGFGSRKAEAQTLPSIDARTWRPSFDPGANLITEPSRTPASGEWNLGAFATYSFRPVSVFKAGSGDVAFRPVEHIAGMDLGGTIGVSDRIAVGASLPLVLWQDGDSGMPSTISSASRAPQFGIGDAALSLKGTLIPNTGGGLGLASITSVTVPTGDRTSFYGDGSVTAQTRVAAEYSFVIVTANASVGYKARTDQHTWPAPEAGGVTFGDEIPWSMGITMNPALFKIDPQNRHRIELAAHGWLPGGPVAPFGLGDRGASALSPVMLTVDDRVEIGHYRDVYALYGADIGLNDAVGVPAFRLIAGIGWSPRDHDMDHDGVADDLDQCPEIAEDRDGFEDSDGCPDIDDDEDGIVDKEDACPRVKGVESTDPKKNGCPPDDRDHDGVPDSEDACPDAWGEKSPDPKMTNMNGCPTTDRDGDGIPDRLDRCIDQPEDKDGYKDDDGCPDPDDDGDGISDKDDACPRIPGEPSSDPTRNGCLNPDRDGDTYDNDADKCPDSAEVFNGVADDDGCPDEGGAPLATFIAKDGKVTAKLATPIKFAGTAEAPEVDAASVMVLRAIATELSRHRDYTLAIGVRPAGTSEAQQQAALSKAFAAVRKLADLAKKDGLAETVGWDAVKTTPNAGNGVGLLVLVTPSAPGLPGPGGTNAPGKTPLTPEPPKGSAPKLPEKK